MIRIELPWPSRDLHPNARVHWAVRAKATKNARSTAAWAARAAKVQHIKAEALTVKIAFMPPDNRRRDLDGMLSSVKAYLDGIADIARIDDSRWHIVPIRGVVTPPHGAVCVEVSA